MEGRAELLNFLVVPDSPLELLPHVPFVSLFRILVQQVTVVGFWMTLDAAGATTLADHLSSKGVHLFLFP